MEAQKHSTISGNSHEDFTGLSAKINDCKDYKESKYVTKGIEKSFTGNIVMFYQERGQYKKRFLMNECCSFASIPTKEEIQEYPESLIYTSEGVFLDSMVEWKYEDNTVYVCSHCGYIFEGKSNVTETEIPKSKSLWLKHEREILDLDDNREEKEPTLKEIMQAENEINMTAL